VSARVIAVDFRARAKPAVPQDAPAVLYTLHPERNERLAYDLYVRASKLDEDSATYDEAQKLYERAVALDPMLAVAYTNLGNIRFRRGDELAAVEWYERALKIDPRQPDALYNLGYVQLERGDARGATVFFNAALQADPRFADAHFNMAEALEQLGERAKARTHWKAYLDVEANGQWADTAREHLDPSYGKKTARKFARTRRERRYDAPQAPTVTPERALNCLESMASWLANQNRPVDD